MPAKHETWMPLYIADYLGDTMHLSTEQHGAYLLLLMAAWKCGGKLPSDDVQLAQIARMPIERWQTHAAAIVLPFFRHDGAIIVHDRVLRELSLAVAKTQQKSAAGAAGAAAKWQKDGRRNGERMADAMRSQWRNDAPSPSPSITSPNGEVIQATRQKSASVPVAKLIADGIPEDLANEWIAHRKRKRALLTPTAWDGVKREAERAGWTPEQAVRKCLARGWTGFEAAWIAGDGKGNGSAIPAFAKRAAIEAHNEAVINGLLRKEGIEP